MKKYSRFATAALASAMTFSAMGMAVMAIDPTTPEPSGEQTTSSKDPLKLTKMVTVRENVPAPATTFNFEITSGEAVEATATTQPILSGPDGGLRFGSGENATTKPSIEFAPIDSEGDITFTDKTDSSSAYYSKSITLQINQDAFTQVKDSEGNITADYSAPGIYRYVVTEKAPAASAYDGMVYNNSKTSYYVDVYKYNPTTEGGEATFEAVAYKLTGGQLTGEKSELDFINDFDSTTGENGTREVVLTKNVTGTQGDKNKKFEFKFTVTSSDTNSSEVYTYHTGKVDKDGNFNPTSGEELKQFNSGDEQTVTLKHEEAVKIYGVSPNDDVVTNESAANDDGYTTTVSGGDKDNNDKETGNLTESITEDKTIMWTNKKDVTTPAGVLLTAAPYAAVVALGGVFAGLFFRRKRED